MKTVYRKQDIIRFDRKVYIFLKRKNILSKFLYILNNVHSRETQYIFWKDMNSMPHKDAITYAFIWATANNFLNKRTNWLKYHALLNREYDTIKINLEKIKIL